jgi:hypothetical protein
LRKGFAIRETKVSKLLYACGDHDGLQGRASEYPSFHNEWKVAPLEGNEGERATCKTTLSKPLTTPRKNNHLQVRALKSPRFYMRHPRTGLEGKSEKGFAIGKTLAWKRLQARRETKARYVGSIYYSFSQCLQLRASLKGKVDKRSAIRKTLLPEYLHSRGNTKGR